MILRRSEYCLFPTDREEKRREEEMHERKRKIILRERERMNELVEKRNIVM